MPILLRSVVTLLPLAARSLCLPMLRRRAVGAGQGRFAASPDRTLVLTAAALLLGGCASAPPQRSGPVQKNDYAFMGSMLDWMVQDGMKRTATPGVVVVVSDGQGMLWSKGYGSASGGPQAAAVSPETCFRVGSVSKVFTATEVARLAAAGRIDLDADLATQLPGFAVDDPYPKSKPITVRALLSHHGGLPTNRLRGMWEPHPVTLAELQMQLRDEPLVAAPQTQYRYSNLGYAMLGRVIEEKSGRPFAAAMARDLLRPLGMNHAAFVNEAAIDPACATGHRKGSEVPAFGLRDAPAGSLVANGNEIAAFLRFVLNDGSAVGADGGTAQVVPAAGFEAMFQPQFAGLPLDFGHRIGLGWMLSGVDVPAAGPIAWHAGRYPGYFTALVADRRDHLAAAVLANDEEAAAFAIDLAAKAIELALEAKTGQAATPRQQAKPELLRNADPATLTALAGDYAVFGAKTPIRREDDHLSAELSGNRLNLMPTADGRFAPQKSVLGLFDLTLPDMMVRFTQVQGQRYAVIEGQRAPIPFERIERKPIPPAWLARLGRYSSTTADNTVEFLDFELAVEDGVLVARVTTNNRITGQQEAKGSVVLEPRSDALAAVPGEGALEGGLIRAKRVDGRDILIYSGYMLMPIRR